MNPPQTAGFTNLDFIGVDVSDVVIGLMIYGAIAGAIVTWAPVLIIVIFALLSGIGLGMIITLIGVIYLENHLPQGRWVSMPHIGGFDKKGTLSEQ